MSEVPLYRRMRVLKRVCPAGSPVRTGSWTGPPRGERAPRVGISSTVFGVRGVRALIFRKESHDIAWETLGRLEEKSGARCVYLGVSSQLILSECTYEA